MKQKQEQMNQTNEKEPNQEHVEQHITMKTDKEENKQEEEYFEYHRDQTKAEPTTDEIEANLNQHIRNKFLITDISGTSGDESDKEEVSLEAQQMIEESMKTTPRKPVLQKPMTYRLIH